MSLWLQAAIEALDRGDYGRLRTKLLPRAPIRIPTCVIRELEFGERRCRDVTRDWLFPIRFLWLLAANEQRMFGLRPSGRAGCHPERLLVLWEQVVDEGTHRRDRETAGCRFDFAEKAMDLGDGWIFVGERFAEDFLEVEAKLGVELLFPDPLSGEGRSAFPDLKRSRDERRPPGSLGTGILGCRLNM